MGITTEWRFDKQLGPHVRRWEYCYLLFDKCSYALLTQGAPWLERIFAWVLMPLLRRVVHSALFCNKPGARERSLQVVAGIFKEVHWFCIFDPFFSSSTWSLYLPVGGGSLEWQIIYLFGCNYFIMFIYISGCFIKTLVGNRVILFTNPIGALLGVGPL